MPFPWGGMALLGFFGAPPLTAETLVALARGRMANSSTRIGVTAILAVAAALIMTSAIPLAWAAIHILVLSIEWRFQRGLKRRAERGETRIGAGLATMVFLQSISANLLCYILWFGDARHGDALTAFYAAAGLANAVVTLRASPLLFFAGAAPTTAIFISLPLIDRAMFGGAPGFDSNFVLLLSLPLIGMAAAAALRVLRRADADRADAEAALRLAEASAAEAAAARAVFADMVRQETHTPLEACASAIESLRREPSADGVSALREAHAVLAATINDLVDLDALDAGRVSLNPQPSDPRALVESVLEVFRADAEAKGLELFLDVAPHTPRSARLDSVRVRQILFHLISNAVKFTAHGGVRVRVQAGPGPRDGVARLSFAVADTGPGLSRQEMAQHMSGRRRNARAGLALCARLARLMNARLAAKSAPQQGALFTLSLDADIVEEAETGAVSALHVLMASDHAAERAAVAAVLSAANVDFDLAETASIALELLSGVRYDLVIADQRMRDLDASEIAALMRDGGPNAATPILVLAHPSAAEACLASGADAVITLPVSAAVLLRQMSHLLGAGEAQAA